MASEPIYLDYNATTPVDPAVLEAMLPYLREHFGNPSSQHAYGRRTHEAVEHARGQVARLLGAHPDEIVFTSGGTEATNHAVKGAAFAAFERGQIGQQVLISAVEHPATQETARFVERLGFKRVMVGVDRYGVVDLDGMERALRAPTLMVGVMHANNETGSLQPVAEIARLARSRSALMHVDAAQSAGKIRVDVGELGADLLTLAGHKMYAPKGIGALFVRRGVGLERLIHGAGHESGRRAGTENVPYIVGLGEACRLAHADLAETAARLKRLCDRLWAHLQEGLGAKVVLNGHPECRLPNTLNASFLGVIGSELLGTIPEIAASTGSACHEGEVSISPVLGAMGLDPPVARGAVRLSLGRYTTEAEVDRAAGLLIERARAAQAR
ncbi:MAG: cysteine desulfurase family protein [Burkholderiales bacterium]